MAKPKSPLLSLGARGTIGDALTYQKRGKEHIARAKPIPRDPYSLNQAYQRWDYRDYAYLWTLLSNSEKQVYRTKASKYHITGFSQWMRENLKALTNLAGRWHLDEKSGATVYDSSRNTNHGTIFGALPAAGIINGAYCFDGINDYIRIDFSPTLETLTSLTIEIDIFPTAYGFPTFNRNILNIGYPTPGSVLIFLPLNNQQRIQGYIYNDAGVWTAFQNDAVTTLNKWYRLSLVWDGATVCLSINTIAGTNPAFTGSVTLPNQAFLAGWSNDFQGIEDHFVIYKRALDATEKQRHSLRRYPA